MITTGKRVKVKVRYSKIKKRGLSDLQVIAVVDTGRVEDVLGGGAEPESSPVARSTREHLAVITT